MALRCSSGGLGTKPERLARLPEVTPYLVTVLLLPRFDPSHAHFAPAIESLHTLSVDAARPSRTLLFVSPSIEPMPPSRSTAKAPRGVAYKTLAEVPYAFQHLSQASSLCEVMTQQWSAYALGEGDGDHSVYRALEASCPPSRQPGKPRRCLVG